MNKYLLFAGLGVVALLGIKAFEASAHREDFLNHTPTSFIHKDAIPLSRLDAILLDGVGVDARVPSQANEDVCVTQEDIAGFRHSLEKVASYSGADADKFKTGLIKVYPDVTLEQLTWVTIDAYRFVAPDGTISVIVTIYNEQDGKVCAAGGGPVPLDDWNKIVIAGGLSLDGTVHDGKTPSMMDVLGPFNLHVDKGQAIMESIDTTIQIG